MPQLKIERVTPRIIEGKSVEVRASDRYTVIEIDGLELYFLRESGKYDGWGKASERSLA